MKSMTGYAKRQCTLGGTRVNVEIKTLNSKQLDLNVKMPNAYRSKDIEIRAMLTVLMRGKIDVVISEESNAETDASLNKDLAVARLQMLRELAAQTHLDIDDSKMLECVVRQPDIWASSTDGEMPDDQWETFSQCLLDTIGDVQSFRQHEGTVLAADFVKHVDTIEAKLKVIPQYEGERIETAKDRIRKYFAELAVKEVDQNRFEQELIYYLEKLDITEEKVRLAKHIDFFRHTMDEEEVSGKKLGFVAQEMGREINTIGSKANHVEIQRLVVEMKDELEKIKEQLGNIL
ncbi:MAG: YicC family protein [Bacteroidales bacterium]|nr:YicC family protein [Bacteroidales bacterium]